MHHGLCIEASGRCDEASGATKLTTRSGGEVRPGVGGPCTCDSVDAPPVPSTATSVAVLDVASASFVQDRRGVSVAVREMTKQNAK